MNIFFWDIDGTLIRTSKAGLFALNKAADDLWGQPVNMDVIEAAGMTDNYISRQMLRSLLGREPQQEEIQSLCRHYESLLPGQLATRQGWVLPQVKEILSYLHAGDDNKLLLLTGNSMEGAEIKLRHFGLDHYFDFSRSAFAASHERRVDIARSAFKTVQEHWGDPRQHNLYVLGDTPHDIECGKAIGAYTVGIATGAYQLRELQQYEPWWAVESLPQPEQFIRHIHAAQTNCCFDTQVSSLQQ